MIKNIHAFPVTRKSLHKLLWAVCEPFLGADIQPVIIGWFQAFQGTSRKQTYKMFRFQYGGHSWSRFASRFSYPDKEEKPAYVTRLEKLAAALAEAKWDELAIGLLPQSAKNFRKDEKKKSVEMFLYIEGVDCYFGVRDLETKEVQYFSVDQDGMMALDFNRDLWIRTWPKQTEIPVFAPPKLHKSTEPKTLDALREKVRWWYNTPLMPDTEVKDYLGNLLKVYFERLAKIGNAVAIATSPHRFDDAGGQDDWLAAFVDGEIWEHGHYFAAPEDKLALAPPQLYEAIGLLNDVTKSGMRQRFSQYLGTSAILPDCMFLSADERGYLLTFSVSNGDGGPVYQVDKETGLPSLIGVAPRLDWQFNAFHGVMHKGEYVQKPKAHIVEFILLEEWLAEQVNNENLPYDYPDLGNI